MAEDQHHSEQEIELYCGSAGKESARSAGAAGAVDLIPGSEAPLEEDMATHSSILAWRIHGQRKLAGYSPWGCKS